MIDNEMDSMLISLVFKPALFCRFHRGNIQHFRQSVKRPLAKATDKPAYPPGLKSQRLAVGSLVSLHCRTEVFWLIGVTRQSYSGSQVTCFDRKLFGFLL